MELKAHKEVIYIPQQGRKVLSRAATIFLEVMAIPAILIAAFASGGQLTLAIVAVFIWRILAAATRWSFVGLIPATSIMTFAILSARTGTSVASDALGLPISTLQTYLLPACIISLFMGALFALSAFTTKPLALKLLEDFLTLPNEAKERLHSVFKGITMTIGVLYIVSAVAGIWVVFSLEEKSAALLTSGLSIGTPLATVIVAAAVTVYLLQRLQVKISFRTETVAIPSL